MTGKVRRILLFLLTLIVLGAIAFALYALRGLEGLPLIGGKDKEPVVTEAPEPTEEPDLMPEEPTPEPAPEVVEQPEPEPAAPEEEDAIFYQKGALRGTTGTLNFKVEVFSAAQSGEETDSVSLGHVYNNPGKILVQFLNADGSAHQQPMEFSFSTENLKQELLTVDLNGDGNEELLILLRTNESEQAVLAFGLDQSSGEYTYLKIAGREDIAWGSGYDAVGSLIWYRHSTNPVQYDCYELQGSELVLVRRLEYNSRADAAERFTEYVVAGDSMLKEQAGVSADEIDHTKWNFVNFN